MKTSNYAKIFLMSENTLAILGGVGDCDLLRFYFVSNDFFFFTVIFCSGSPHVLFAPIVRQ